MRRPVTTMRHVVTMFSAAVACMLLVAGWHAAGLAGTESQSGYPLSSYLGSCVSWSFVAAWLSVAAVLGALRHSAWAVGAGMVLPLPVAALVEIARDPRSHNLLGIEILLWVPVLLLAFGAARLGDRARQRREGSAT